MPPQHTPAGNGLWFLNGHVSFADAPTGMAIADHHMPFGDAPPTHVHYREEEIFHLKSGVIRFRVGEQEVLARAGDTVVAPRGVPHAFRVESPQGARVLVITTSTDLRNVIEEFSRPATDLGLPEWHDVTPEEGERLALVCRKHGLELVGPPLAA